MANDFIPRQDSQALAWMRTFAGNISTNPPAYMLALADAATIQSAVDAFGDAMAVTGSDESKTKVTVRIKDQARNSAEQVCRQYASLIKPNAGISDADKIAIGVRPMNPSRTPINCPQTSPLVAVIAATPYSHTLRYRDSITPASRGKPFGATFIEMRVAVADVVVNDVEQARPVGMFTKNPVGIGFTHDDDRKKATYFARWVSRRGETGPWSSPVSMTIAA